MCGQISVATYRSRITVNSGRVPCGSSSGNMGLSVDEFIATVKK
jgi:hypothetical protein